MMIERLRLTLANSGIRSLSRTPAAGLMVAALKDSRTARLKQLLVALSLLCAPDAFGQDSWATKLTGKFEGELQSSGSLLPVTTEFISNGRGTYIFIENGASRVRGELDSCSAPSYLKLRCHWKDVYGDGWVAFVFDQGLRRFAGNWQSAKSAASFAWTGVATGPTVGSPAQVPTPPQLREQAQSRELVPLKRMGGTFVVSALINGAISLDFVVDSGAADVSVPADVVMTLMRAGTLSSSDFLGSKTYVLADGTEIPSQTFRIRSLKVGAAVVQNVVGSIAPVTGSLLLGQSFLGRFRSWSIDNHRGVLVLE